MVASCSPDDIVKIMDVSHFNERPKDGSFNLEAYEATLEHKANHGKIVKESKQEKKDGSDGWSSDSDEDSDSDDSDDSDDSMDENNKNHKKRNKQLNPKQNSSGLTRRMLEQKKAQEFFKDM